MPSEKPVSSPSRGITEAVLWLIASVLIYLGVQYLFVFVVQLALMLGAQWDVMSNSGLLVYRSLLYVATAGVLAGAMWYRYKRLSLSDISLTRLLSWKDIGLSIAGVVLYIIATMVVLGIAGALFGVNTTESQNLGLTRLSSHEVMTAFFVLVLITPFFEEVLFRGFLYGRLRQAKVSWWIPAIVVSALFGLAHGQWNVGLDVFCLSMVACALREVTGSIWSGILLHMVKNLIAFLVVYVGVAGL